MAANSLKGRNGEDRPKVIRGGRLQRVASAMAASEDTAVTTTVAVAVVTKANTTAKRMKILRMTRPHVRCGVYARGPGNDL